MRLGKKLDAVVVVHGAHVGYSYLQIEIELRMVVNV